jgi:hypothetical protein
VGNPVGAKWSEGYINRYLEPKECDASLPDGVARCGFDGEAGRKYELEVNLTRDSSLLDAGDPHLIVVRHQYR